MIRNLGALGLVGLSIIVAGIGLIAWADPIVAAGIALVLAGLGLVVKALITNLLSGFGMF